MNLIPQIAALGKSLRSQFATLEISVKYESLCKMK